MVAADNHRGDWGVLADGTPFYPTDLRAVDIRIDDIARSLAKQCRFLGHCADHYSVAEHSVLVSYEVPPKHALQGLLHDATEAYLHDIIRPVKRALGDTYAALEHRAWLAICERFDISVEMHESVHLADNAVLLAERHQLFPAHTPAWSVPGEPAKCIVMGYEWREARKLFLARFKELTS